MCITGEGQRSPFKTFAEKRGLSYLEVSMDWSKYQEAQRVLNRQTNDRLAASVNTFFMPEAEQQHLGIKPLFPPSELPWADHKDSLYNQIVLRAKERAKQQLGRRYREV